MYNSDGINGIRFLLQENCWRHWLACWLQSIFIITLKASRDIVNWELKAHINRWIFKLKIKIFQFHYIFVFVSFTAKEPLFCLSCSSVISPRHCHNIRKCDEGQVRWPTIIEYIWSIYLIIQWTKNWILRWQLFF